MRPANFAELLPILDRAGVQFIVIGGGAGIAHGLARLTYDVDVVYSRSPANLQRIIEALRDYQPYPRGAPAGLPFLWDAQMLNAGMNFTLNTTLGAIDLLGEVTGGGSYEKLLPDTVLGVLYGMQVRIVTLEKLIELKRAAGRPKDYEVLSQLQVLLKERRLRESESA
jgi:predicted nucleotidyltransferase